MANHLYAILNHIQTRLGIPFRFYMIIRRSSGPFRTGLQGFGHGIEQDGVELIPPAGRRFPCACGNRDRRSGYTSFVALSPTMARTGSIRVRRLMKKVTAVRPRKVSPSDAKKEPTRRSAPLAPLVCSPSCIVPTCPPCVFNRAFRFACQIARPARSRASREWRARPRPPPPVPAYSDVPHPAC